MEFVDTEEEFAYFTDGGYDRAMRDVALAEQDGFIEAPDWFPIGLDGYEYIIIGMTAVMKPKPKLRHILRYKRKLDWYSRWQARRYIKRFFEELKTE